MNSIAFFGTTVGHHNGAFAASIYAVNTWLLPVMKFKKKHAVRAGTSGNSKGKGSERESERERYM